MEIFGQCGSCTYFNLIMCTDASSLTFLSALTESLVLLSVFKECHKVINYEPFIVACKFDVCHMHLDHIGCTSLQTYAEACAEAGVCVAWRNATDGLCGMLTANIITCSHKST